MGYILIVAPFPAERLLGDGFVQRVKNIDDSIGSYQRKYLNVHYKRLTSSALEEVSDTLESYELHWFRDRKKINQLVRSADLVYVHSIYNYARVVPFLGKAKVVLDVHGIVPEELDYSGRRLSSFLFSVIERFAFSRIHDAIVVTNSMKEYLQKKYPKSEVKFSIVPIVSQNTLKISDSVAQLPIPSHCTVFVYSGNFQKWQCAEKVIEFIDQVDHPQYCYLFLTHDETGIKNLLGTRIERLAGRVICIGVKPSDLYLYYNLAHYGFLVREHHPLNRVANPTKMLEYLFYGITPIVDLVEIGDYRDYEHVDLLNPPAHFEPQKSNLNREIARRFLSTRGDETVRSLISQRSD